MAVARGLFARSSRISNHLQFSRSQHLLSRRNAQQLSRPFLRSTDVASSRNMCPFVQVLSRPLTTSQRLCGLEEFFPDLSMDMAMRNRTGRHWTVSELRQKDDTDLHKLWYVLLKERNLLLTLRHEANRIRIQMPAPERLWKVRQSMKGIKIVLAERRAAILKARKMKDPNAEIIDADFDVDEEDEEPVAPEEEKSTPGKRRWSTYLKYPDAHSRKRMRRR